MTGRSYGFRTTSALIASILLAITFAASSAIAQCLPNGQYDGNIPCGFRLVGTTGGVADPLGEFSVIVRDFTMSPVPNCEVTIDFGACEPDIRIATNQPYPGLRVECDANGARIIATTDATGRAIFRIVGAANAAAGGPAAGFKCATVYAGATNLGTINVAAFDLDGGGGSTAADVSLFLGDYFRGDYVGRSDYDCTNTISAADFSLLIQGPLKGGSTQSGVIYCF